MTESDDIQQPAADAKPCLALMGEFSAGKSTLSNLLIGGHSLPVQVTATQLPPVWIAYGDKPPYRVDLDGNVMPVDLNELGSIRVDDTAYIRIFRKSDVLEITDIIDMPGISDPSMAADVWQRVIHHATSVIWCTHATQAWRQSEAAVWDSMPPELHQNSLLLLTRMDKIVSENDRQRLLRRVKKETQGLFRDVLPISLLQAIESGSDRDAWEASGAGLFTEALVGVLRSGGGAANDRDMAEAGKPDLALVETETAAEDAATPPTAAAGAVMPKRVTPRTGLRPTSRRGERPASRAASSH